ncbi:MAG: hypothetical protein Q9186_004887 [Xanthomendoza sp. 1 TL-2023]
MSTQLTIPSEYGYVLLTASLSTLVGYYHLFHTGNYRKAAKVPYPNAYATAAEAKESKEKYLFNCAQRSHVTFLEVPNPFLITLPTPLPPLIWLERDQRSKFLTTLLISGLNFPLFSSAMGLIWIAGRIVYLRGYTDPNKEQGAGRQRGSFNYIGGLGLLGGAFVSAISITGMGDKVMELLR